MILVFGTALAALLPLPSEAVEEKVALGFHAPDFEVQPIGGGEKVKLSQFRGEVLLINFWATWCAPCVSELPDLAKLHNHFKDRSFRVLAVNVDKTRKAGQQFLEEHGLDLPLFWTEPGDGLQEQYQASLLPATYLINQDGVIVAKEYGPRRWFSDETRQKISDLITSPLH